LTQAGAKRAHLDLRATCGNLHAPATAPHAMTQPDFVLYHAWASSASRKVRFCMAEKGLTFQGLVLDLNRFQHHTDWYKRLNPSGIVPCLVVDGHPLIESNLINEYLDEAYPTPPLMPDDPFDRHELRRWSKYIDDVCLPAVQKPNWTQMMRPMAEKWTDEELAARLAAIPSQERRDLWTRMARKPFTQAEIDAALDILEDMTVQIDRYLEKSGGPWIFGARFTLADINVSPYVVRFEEERPGHLRPRVADWWARLTARPAWKAAQVGGFMADSERSVVEAMADPE
jgi:glutathione S-transferase